MTINQVFRDTKSMTWKEVLNLRTDLLISYLKRVQELENDLDFPHKSLEYRSYDFWFGAYIMVAKAWLWLPGRLRDLFRIVPDFCYMRFARSTDALYGFLNMYTPGSYEILTAVDEIYLKKLHDECLEA